VEFGQGGAGIAESSLERALSGVLPLSLIGLRLIVCAFPEFLEAFELIRDLS
jgi:hypothetical protein